MIAAAIYRFTSAHRRLVLSLVLALAAISAVLATGIGIDMSFRPTFSTEHRLVGDTGAHDARFGEVGFRDVVAIVQVGDLHDRTHLQDLADLSARLSAIDHVETVRDPTDTALFDRQGNFVPASLRDGDGQLLDGAQLDQRVDDLLAAPQLRRVMISDDGTQVAVAATLGLPNTDFSGRRAVVSSVERTVSQWSDQTGLTTQVTGYPAVEQVYATTVTHDVLQVIAVLYVVMIGVLYAYFRKWRHTLITLSGVSLAVPILLAEMRLLGQPFSIVNSQVLTLVVIVGIAHALHHVEEYRRRREHHVGHTDANRLAFSTLAFPSLMTGLAAVIGFLSLRAANMPAVRSFGLCTAAGVATVYVMNWLVVPLLVELSESRAEGRHAAGRADRPSAASRATERFMGGVANVVDRRPGRVIAGFALTLVVLGAFGIPHVSVNQKVNQELPAGHPALAAQQRFEDQFSGFLGPELWLRPADPATDVLTDSPRLAEFVNRVCALPAVRYVASPLDLTPQPALAQPAAPGVEGSGSCQRQAAAGDLAALRPLLATPADNLRPTVDTLLGPGATGHDATVVVRMRDIGTANTLPFVRQVQAIADDVYRGSVSVTPVGPWWLAQNGMNRLSVDVGFSACWALALILPVIALSIRDRRLFAAAILPTILPVVAALGFMGLTGIPVRIGTAMILAIALGLAADDTIYLSLQVKRRLAAGSDAASAFHGTLRRTGRPACYSSVVLIAGFLSMTTNSLLALRDMGIVAAFTMTYSLAADVILGPATYRLIVAGDDRRRARRVRRAANHRPLADVASPDELDPALAAGAPAPTLAAVR